MKRKILIKIVFLFIAISSFGQNPRIANNGQFPQGVPNLKIYDINNEAVETQNFYGAAVPDSINDVYKVNKAKREYQYCIDTLCAAFNSVKNDRKFKILILPFYQAGNNDDCKTDFGFYVKSGIKTIAQKEGLNVYCEILDCGSSPSNYGDAEISALKQRTSADLVIYGSYSSYCNDDSASICINWIGDTIKIQNGSDTSKSLQLGPFKREYFETKNITLKNVISGHLKTSLDFIVLYSIGLSKVEDSYFLRALSKAASVEDTIACFKQLAVNYCSCDTQALVYVNYLLETDSSNINYQIIKASVLSYHFRYKEALEVLNSIARIGLDTTLLSINGFYQWLYYTESALGNNEPLLKAISRDSHNINYLNILLSHYIATRQMDSIIALSTVILEEFNPINVRHHIKQIITEHPEKSKWDTLKIYYNDTILLDLNHVGISRLSRDSIRELRNQDVVLDFYPKVYLFTRGVAEGHVGLLGSALKDLDFVDSIDTYYVDFDFYTYEDVHLAKSIVLRKIYRKKYKEEFLEEALNEMRESLRVSNIIFTDDYSEFKADQLGKRYLEMAYIFKDLGNTDSINFYYELSSSCSNVSTNINFKRAIKVLTHEFDPILIEYAKRDLEIEIENLKKHKTDFVTLVYCYYNLGVLYLMLEEPNTGSKYFKLAIKTIQNIDSKENQEIHRQFLEKNIPFVKEKFINSGSVNNDF